MSPEVEEALRDRLAYEPETGRFWHKIHERYVGTLDKQSGYIRVGMKIRGRAYYFQAHRIAWFLQTGSWPYNVDHKNRIKTDNVWSNLRAATHAQNMINRDYPRSVSLPRGVYQSRDRYRVLLRVNGVQTHLGSFDTVEEAHSAWLVAAEATHGKEWLPQ